MKRFKRTILLGVMSFLLLFGVCGCKKEPLEDVIILYTNDIHTYIANEQPAFNYASVAALKKKLVNEGKNVILVDAGDFSQGSAYGAMDEGATIVKLMNEAGYDVATLGNHEFDYGQFRAFGIMDEINFPLISCNFYKISDKSLVLDAYKIVEKGNVKIAFIGISTPETITKSTPVYFQNEKGEYIYNFYGSEGGNELYERVQKTIDEVKNKADYIIAVGHLGIDPSSEPFTSRAVIANTTGLNAFIDGHSHSVVEGEIVKDKDGKAVVLTQTGSYLSAIGKMTISNNEIHTELISDFDTYDESVSKIADEWISSVNGKLGIQIAVLDIPMYINDPDNDSCRIVRNHETNLGDFCADSIYYYLNEKAGLDCDIVIANGGGVRAPLKTGEYTYLSSKSVNPFSNVICLVEITGSQLRDVLEKGAMFIGDVDPTSGRYAENGGFMHVAGLKYTIDTTIPSTVQTDDKDLWLSGPTGDYRVNDVSIYDKEKGVYEPLDLNKTYKIGGYNYLLRNQGCGLTMLSDLNVIQDYIMEDYLMLSEYAKNFTKGIDGMPHISTKNSPLFSYDGYMIDYDDPYGAGRITIISEE